MYLFPGLKSSTHQKRPEAQISVSVKNCYRNESFRNSERFRWHIPIFLISCYLHILKPARGRFTVERSMLFSWTTASLQWFELMSSASRCIFTQRITTTNSFWRRTTVQWPILMFAFSIAHIYIFNERNELKLCWYTVYSPFPCIAVTEAWPLLLNKRC